MQEADQKAARISCACPAPSEEGVAEVVAPMPASRSAPENHRGHNRAGIVRKRKALSVLGTNAASQLSAESWRKGAATSHSRHVCGA